MRSHPDPAPDNDEAEQDDDELEEGPREVEDDLEPLVRRHGAGQVKERGVLDQLQQSMWEPSAVTDRPAIVQMEKPCSVIDVACTC